MSSAPLRTAPLNSLRTLFPPRNYATRFQHVIEQMPSAVWVVVPRTGQLVTINSRTTALTGWTREELLKCALAEFILSPEALQAFHALQPGNVRQLLAVPVLTHGDRPLPMDIRISAFDDGGEVLVLAQATPTEARQAQELEKARHEHLIRHLNLVLELFDAPTAETLPPALERVAAAFSADAAGLYRTLPESGELRLELRHNLPRQVPLSLRAEQAGPLKSPLTWNSTQRADNPLAQAFRAAGWAHLIAQPLGKAPTPMGVLFLAYQVGSPPPLAAAPYLEVAACHFTQLIRQVARHARLLDAQRLTYVLTNQLSALQSQVSEGILFVNASGAVDELNPAAARMLGYRPEDVIGLKVEDVLSPDETLARVLQAALNNPTMPGEKEGEVHRRNGEALPVMLRVRPLPPPAGGCVVVLSDLSQLRAEELKREQLDHLAYIGQSTAAFAHEVRAPLNNISMGVQFIASRLSEDDPLQPSLAKIQAEATRLSELMNNMLAWTKPIEPKLRLTDLRPMLERLLSRWSAKLQQRNIIRALHVPTECPLVLADAGLLERVFVNLIENAIQAMPTGGHLTISLQAADRGPQGAFLDIKVADSGNGIPEEHRKRIFDPYFTTRADGTGLGLAICKRIVTVHRGAISVESFPGTGTIFTVTLPALPPLLSPTEANG
ncbi:MAG: ATP-binding protein [Anaerolineales bacterium]|nr:ATP-binding protein [Anaerolineales bacterium]